MKIMSFEELCNRYRPYVDTGKEREKYADIVETVGVTARSLKRGDSKADENGTGKIPWMIPQESAEFVAWTLDSYVTPAFKAMRKADFRAVPLDVSEKLEEGFGVMLESLGHDAETVRVEREKMRGRLLIGVKRGREKIAQSVQALEAFLDKCENEAFAALRNVDLPPFFDFVSERLNELTDYVSEVYGEVEEIRNEERNNQAWEMALNLDGAETTERINQDLILNDALEKDAEYVRLRGERQALLQSDKFVKKLKPPFLKVCNKMDEIRRRYEIELFDAELPPETWTEEPLKIQHPSEVLQEAIRSVEENREARRKLEEARAKRTPEDERRMREEFERIRQKMGWPPFTAPESGGA